MSAGRAARFRRVMAALRQAAVLLVGSLGAIVLGCASDDGSGAMEVTDAAVAKIGSQRAYELVRDEVPDLPVLAVSDYGDVLDPDGRAEAWVFTFDIGDPEQVLSVRASGDGSEVTEPVTSRVPSICEKRPTIEMFDSERLVPHAVLQLEERTGRRFDGQLRMQFGHCSDRPESNVIRLEVGDQGYFARYWGDGRFIELAGPCGDDLFDCLEGR